MTRRPASLALLVATGLALGACARPMTLLAPPLATDRPSFSTGTSITPVGFPQLEAGLTYGRTEGAKVLGVGEATLRAGVSPKAELRLTIPSYVRVRPDAVKADGFGDAAIGAKLLLAEGPVGADQPDPVLALLVGTSLPTGAEALGSDKALPTAALIAGWSLTDRTGLTANLIWGQADTGSGTASTWGAVLGLGFSHTAKLGSFAEVYSTRDPAGDWDDPWVVGGFTYLATRVVQLDVHGGLRSRDPGEGYFVGFGISRRY